MGRSRPAPPFRTPEGANDTVLEAARQSARQNCGAYAIRDSRTAASGNPTMVNPAGRWKRGPQRRPRLRWLRSGLRIDGRVLHADERSPRPAMSPSVGYEGVPSGTTELPARLKTLARYGYPVVWSCPALLNNGHIVNDGQERPIEILALVPRRPLKRRASNSRT